MGDLILYSNKCKKKNTHFIKISNLINCWICISICQLIFWNNNSIRVSTKSLWQPSHTIRIQYTTLFCIIFPFILLLLMNKRRYHSRVLLIEEREIKGKAILYLRYCTLSEFQLFTQQSVLHIACISFTCERKPGEIIWPSKHLS